jgi:hypothetical protein
MNCQFMFCFYVNTRDFEREGRFFHGSRKLFGTTFRRFSRVKEIPVEEITLLTYSTSSSPSLVFLGLTATLNSRSLEKTLQIFAWKAPVVDDGIYVELTDVVD